MRAERASKPSASPAAGYRSDTLRERNAREISWRHVPYTDESSDGRIDPRTFTLELDRLLPAERVVAVDSGNFMGYPGMFLSVPDESGFCFTQAFQCSATAARSCPSPSSRPSCGSACRW